jgi:hypothetical protein
MSQQVSMSKAPFTFFLLLLLGIAVGSPAQYSKEDEKLFDEAVQLTHDRLYELAIPVWKKLRKRHPDHPGLHFYSGLALFSTTDDKDTSTMTEEELKAEEFAFPDFLVVLKESTEEEGMIMGKDGEMMMDEKGMLGKEGELNMGGGGSDGCHCDESSPTMKGGKMKKGGSKDMMSPGMGKGDDMMSSPGMSSKGGSMDTFALPMGGKRRL